MSERLSRCFVVLEQTAVRCRWGIDASDPRWGDGHYYNYGGDCLDVRVYPRSKFVSEFGFQSYPSFSVLKEVSAPEDWAYDSAFANYRCAPVFPATSSYVVPAGGHTLSSVHTKAGPGTCMWALRGTELSRHSRNRARTAWSFPEPGTSQMACTGLCWM
jgi:hypothetical protein